MINKNMTAKERGLVKGAIRRVFSRSDLRRRVVEAAQIDYHDESRPRVTKWCRCAECKKPTPKYLTECDHLSPVVPLDKSLEEMSWDMLMDRLWCEESNLQAVCKACHKLKSSSEAKARREYRKSKKNT